MKYEIVHSYLIALQVRFHSSPRLLYSLTGRSGGQLTYDLHIEEALGHTNLTATYIMFTLYPQCRHQEEHALD